MSEPSIVRVVGGPALEAKVPLEWQYEVDGKVWTEITVRRQSVGQIAAYADAVKVAQADGKPIPKPPMFDCPQALLDALFPSDDDRLTEASASFLDRARPADPTSPSTAAETP